MPRGDKSSYTDKQKRMAEHIEEGYEKRGVADQEAERRAWATVNKERFRPWQEAQRGFIAQRRTHRRAGFRQPPGGRAFPLGKEGRRDPQARRLPLTVNPFFMAS